MHIHTSLRIAALLFATTLSTSSLALDILVSNDDGFESSLSYALYQKLKAAGHRVIISASTQDQSGQGSATSIMRPLNALAKDTRGGSVKAGAPPIGTLPSNEDIHYIDGSPGMSVLYAIDAIAPKLWQKKPDLVITGPNFGNNLAAITVGSGTVAAGLFALNRGIPAIMVSDGHSHHYRSLQQLAEGDIDYEIADVTLRLVAQLEAQAKKNHRPLLPPGIGLNVNIPAFAAGEGKTIKYRLTRIGHQMALYFSSDLSQDPNAKAMGVNLPAAPGFSYAMKEIPSGLDLPIDTDPRAETVALKTNVVAVSVIQGIPQADKDGERAIRRRLQGLIGSR